MPPQALKKPNQPVGLKNQGATCYMNSFLQQLYAIEDFRNHLLELEDPSEDLANSPLFQLQVLFGYVPLSCRVLVLLPLPFTAAGAGTSPQRRPPCDRVRLPRARCGIHAGTYA